MNRKELAYNIENKKNLQESLPVAMNVMSSDYFVYSALQFTMNFYNYYEITCESKVEETDTMFDLINQLVEKTILAPFDGQIREEAIKQIDCLRSEIIQVMQELTAYADKFAIYEYILNRLEKNYEDDLADLDNDAVSSDIMQTIFSDQDQVLINSRIRAMLSQLPVRMTKNRFFDMLKDSLSIYEGSDISSVEDYVYMLKTATGLETKVDKVEVTTESIKELEANLAALKAIDMVMLSQEKFKEAIDLLTLAVEKIQTITDRYFSLAEVVNGLYTLLLNQPYASLEAVNEAKALYDITPAIVAANKEKNQRSLEDEVVEKFEQTEGKLEQYIQYLAKNEGMIDDMEQSAMDEIGAQMLGQQYTTLQLSKNLCSNSVFIELHEQKVEGKANQEYLNNVYEKLVQDFSDLLKNNNKLYNRAVIASALREMPVIFNSKQEVEDYIKNALAGCHDISEKVSSVELFQSACE